VVVNQTFAQRFFPGETPIGRYFDVGAEYRSPTYEIVGVVSDAKYRSMRETPPTTFYTSNYGPSYPPIRFILYLRTNDSPATLVQSVHDVLRSIDPRMPIYEVSTLAAEIERSLWRERLVARLASGLALFAIGLAAMGLYAVLAHFVATHRRELALRLALGARLKHIARTVSLQTAPTVVLGVAAGLVLCWMSGSWIGGLLYGVEAFDPKAVFSGITIVILIVFCATVGPIVRASCLDPISNLRKD
jgi:predicted lysophospholipase L1 biosynthesis ABC-type transport system permease subunit